MSKIGNALKEARIKRNVTQKQLAAYFHVQHSSISMIEDDELDPGPGLEQMIQEWIRSGKGVTISAPRGAYRK